MKSKKSIFAAFAAAWVIGVSGINYSGFLAPSVSIVSAAPQNNSNKHNNVYTGGKDSKDKDTKEVVSNLFGGDHSDLSEDPTGYSDVVVSPIVSIIKWFLSIVMGLFVVLAIVHLVVDMIMYKFPSMVILFTEKIPIPLFSKEMGQLLGVQHQRHTNGAGPGGAPAPAGPQGGPGGAQQMTFKSYLTQTLLTTAICLIILILCVTGVLPNLLYTLGAYVLDFFKKKGF